ncbi:tetR family transcriptional regulator [Mycobacterium xenopi 4042]|uniref:TetR family transcriptional regulator n=1 Tax=Mycobacterium xenopi 4042 TaxID=1299334 RepID=X8AJC1_MYCXE|nr:tetR family transcriptional regulator [Mycobacterium xenopi 4042]
MARRRVHLLLLEEPSDRRGVSGLGRQVPYFTDVNEPMAIRVDKALRHLALVVADEPEVAAACTTALLGVALTRGPQGARRIGAEIHRRITSAIGPDADPRTVAALEMAFFGALVQAGSGALPTTRSPTGSPT